MIYYFKIFVVVVAMTQNVLAMKAAGGGADLSVLYSKLTKKGITNHQKMQEWENGSKMSDESVAVSRSEWVPNDWVSKCLSIELDSLSLLVSIFLDIDQNVRTL